MYLQDTQNFHTSSAVKDALAPAINTPSKKISNGNTYSHIVTCDNDTVTRDMSANHGVPLLNGDAYGQPHDVIQARRLPSVPGIPVDSAGVIENKY